ncbi:hypothetical protein [Candidatus Sororendozoicomonas aggregata]|uniref:hypothetical protein n=1 Tax=Candidatus Sororendozoicomonas aggregata TaxID=3073239 RepID=UPI002ED4CE60
MRKKPLLQFRKCMANKSVVFFTGVLSLCALDNAYSKDAFLLMKDAIPQGQPYYSKKGFTLKASGHGSCMLGVYGPHKCTVANGDGFCFVGIHYKSSLGCAFKDSSQNFIVINNDTGKVVGTLQWKKKADRLPPPAKKKKPYIIFQENPDSFMVDITGLPSEPNALNLKCSKHSGANFD